MEIQALSLRCLPATPAEMSGRLLELNGEAPGLAGVWGCRLGSFAQVMHLPSDWPCVDVLLASLGETPS